MLTRFIIYGFTGWCIEIFWTGLGSLIRGDRKLRGWTYLWMFPIYGLAVFLEPIHNFIRDWPFFLRGIIYVIFIWSIEYFTGFILKNTVKVCPWDYSKATYSIKGLIRLDYGPAWFLAGLLFEKLHDLLIKLSI